MNDHLKVTYLSVVEHLLSKQPIIENLQNTNNYFLSVVCRYIQALRSQRLVIKMFKRIASSNCFVLGSSREYVAELVKEYDLVALQET